MKLAYFAPEFLPTWGGVGIYSVELLKKLSQDKDMDIHVITPTRGKSYNKQEILDYFDNNITIHNISHANDGFFYNFHFQLALWRKFGKINKEHNFDLVHAANLVHMPDIYLKFQKQSIPSLTTIHTTLQSQSRLNGTTELKKNSKSVVEQMTGLFYPVIQHLEKKYVKKSQNFISVSKWVQQFVDLNENHMIDVIHNGIDTRKFENATNEFNFLRKKKGPIILYTGRLLEMKGLGTLIKSMKIILKNTDAHFVFAGSGNIVEWEKELRGVPKEFYTFLDYVPYEKIHSLYHAADVFVLPSYTESFPLSILEAMASSLPVVASRVGGIPEMIHHMQNGILVDAGNEQQLAHALLLVLENDSFRKKLGYKAHKHVREHFDSSLMAAKTKKFYERVLNEN